MKGFNAGIPIAILAAVGNVQAQQGIGVKVTRPIHESALGNIGEDVTGPIHHIFKRGLGFSPAFEDDKGSHYKGGHHQASPFNDDFEPSAAHPHDGPGHARHPPMAHAARAFRPGEDAPSIDEGNSFFGGNPGGNPSEVQPADHGPVAIPTCSTRTEHVVHTVTKTFTLHHEHSGTPTPFGLDPGYHASNSHGPAGPASSSAAHAPAVPHAPHTSSAAHAPHTSSAAHMANAPHTSSAHSALIPASTQAPSTSTSTVHGPMTYNVIPVNVPHSSHSSIKLHASSTPLSSSAYPSGVDGTFHNPYGTPSAGVSFTGAGAQLVPNTGVVTAVCGLLGVLAYAL